MENNHPLDHKLKLLKRSILADRLILTMNDFYLDLHKEEDDFADPESLAENSLICRYLDAQIKLSTAYENILLSLKENKLPSCEHHQELRETSQHYLDAASSYDIAEAANEKVRKINKQVNKLMKCIADVNNICVCRHMHHPE